MVRETARTSLKPGRKRAKHILDMLFTDISELALTNPQAAVAIATGDLVSVTFALVLVTTALVAVGCVIGVFQIRVVSRGIDKMTKASKTRDKRHRKTMKAETRRHTEAMAAQQAARDADADRHREAMDALTTERQDSQDRHREAMDALAAERHDSQHRHDQTMKALNALIRASGRQNRPIHAR